MRGSAKLEAPRDEAALWGVGSAARQLHEAMTYFRYCFRSNSRVLGTGFLPGIATLVCGHQDGTPFWLVGIAASHLRALLKPSTLLM